MIGFITHGCLDKFGSVPIMIDFYRSGVLCVVPEFKRGFSLKKFDEPANHLRVNTDLILRQVIYYKKAHYQNFNSLAVI